MGKMALMVSETSFTESSIPPIWANAGKPIRSIAQVTLLVFFMTVRFVARLGPDDE